jgi:hypothetical protein
MIFLILQRIYNINESKCELKLKNTLNSQKQQKSAIFRGPYNTLVLGPFLGRSKTDLNLAYFNKNIN